MVLTTRMEQRTWVCVVCARRLSCDISPGGPTDVHRELVGTMAGIRSQTNRRGMTSPGFEIKSDSARAAEACCPRPAPGQVGAATVRLSVSSLVAETDLFVQGVDPDELSRQQRS